MKYESKIWRENTKNLFLIVESGNERSSRGKAEILYNLNW